MASARKKIGIFTDFSVKPTVSTPASFVLYDWWHSLSKGKLDFKDKSEFRDTDRFGGLIATCHQQFDYHPEPTRSDYAVLPCDWKYFVREDLEERAINFLHRMKEIGKRTIVQYNCDDDLPVQQFSSADSPFVDIVLLLRTSFHVSRQMPNEYAMPGFIGDPIKVYCGGNIPLRRKNRKPTVSFCGQVEKGPMRMDQIISFYQQVSNAFQGMDEESKNAVIYAFRAVVLDLLSCSEVINGSMIRRDGYCGGIDKVHDNDGLVRVRQEYYSNMINSDYVVCVRGKGNYSYRFYEALALGRIPIFVDTDSPLPFSSTIEWSNHCVFVKERQIMDISEIVASHYAGLSDKGLADMQIENRRLFETLLTPERYFPVLLKTLAV